MSPTTVDEVLRRRRTPGEARLLLLQERGCTLTEIARELAVDLSVVSRVNRGERRARRVEAAIAEALGLSLTLAFPEHKT